MYVWNVETKECVNAWNVEIKDDKAKDKYFKLRALELVLLGC